MDTNGKVLQQFIDEPKQEKDVLKEFSEWLIKEKPILVSYSSTSADKPQLVRNFKRFNLPTVELEKSFFDLYYDCISTQRIRDQRIFLPICNSIGLKEVAHYFGYREPRLEIRDGFQALSEYENFLHINEKEKDRIKKDLLNYNKADLERTKFIFEKLKNLFYMKTSLETFSH
jgi:uncharacterized protein YprB with RNaseH-like and TPR domain